MLEKMLEIAAPIIRHYKTDLTRHDSAMLDSFDLALWGPYEMGTHLTLVSFAGMTRDDARRARELFDAQCKVFGKQIPQWYLLNASRQTVTPISVESAFKLFR